MTDDENLDLQAALRAAYDDAVSYVDEELAPGRAEAQRLYNGEKFGALTAEEGRSSVVLTEVRDVILSMLPSLLRTLAGSKVFEFLPRNASDVEVAETLTAYVNDVVLGQDNPGFKILHDAIKDALLFKMGIVRWYWDTSTSVSVEHYTGLSPDQAALLKGARDEEEPEVVEETVRVCNCDGMADGDLAHLRGLAEDGGELPRPGSPIRPAPEEAMSGEAMSGEAMSLAAARAEPGAAGAAIQEAAMPHGVEVKVDLKLKRIKKHGRARVECVPPEEFLADFRRARDIDTAGYVAFRSYRTVSELVAMYGQEAREAIEEHAGTADEGLGMSEMEAMARNPGASAWGDAAAPDPSQRRVLHVESYILFDGDGDGIAERHRVCSIGDACRILHDEIVPDEPVCAVFTVDSVPHTIVGQSIADQIGDVQVIKSSILRNTLDSLAQSIHPRTVVVTRDVESMDDVLNHETGAIIRVRNPGAVQELTTSFVGQNSMPILAYMDEVRSRRSGVTATTTGLDPDALQSTSPTAINAAQEAGQQRLELIARLLAETGLRPLAKGLLRLLVRNQDRPRIVRLREKMVEIDPSGADIEMDVGIQTAIGRDDAMQKAQLLMQVMQKQEQVIGMLGPSNPIAGVVEWRNSAVAIADAFGIKDVEKFFKAITPQTLQMLQQGAGGQNKPDPNMLLAQAELAKAQAEAKKIEISAVVEQQKLELERHKIALEDDRIRRRDLYEIEIKAAEIQAKYGAQVDMAKIEADVGAEVQRDQHLVSALADVAKHATPQPQAPAPQAPQPGVPA